MPEQGYNYYVDDVSVQNLTVFFESRCENLEAKPEIKRVRKGKSPLRNAMLYRFKEIPKKILLRMRNPRIRGYAALTTDAVVKLQISVLYLRS